jgi:hypothetical protein
MSDKFCVGCEIELSDKNGSLMDGRLRGTPHTCGKAVSQAEAPQAATPRRGKNELFKRPSPRNVPVSQAEAPRPSAPGIADVVQVHHWESRPSAENNLNTAENVARLLSETDVIQPYGPGYECVLCGGSGSDSEEASSNHATMCPYRIAKEWMQERITRP